MHKVRDFSEIQGTISRIRAIKQGYITNFFPDKFKATLWIDRKLLYKVDIGGSTFYIRKDTNFFSLYFISSTLGALEQGLRALLAQYLETTFVADLVGSESVLVIKNIFESAGFYDYVQMVRMNRVDTTALPSPAVTPIRKANLDDIEILQKFFKEYFDPMAEQVPFHEEFVNWINKENILIYEIEEQLAGFIIYELNGATLYLRYWFVHPAFREQKIGSALFKYFLDIGNQTKRQLFWVITSNENAIKRYRHYGFKEENMYNYIIINKNLGDEK